MALSSDEKPDNEFKNKIKINNYIVSFQLEKITYNNQEGFFIPFVGYKQLLLILNDYIYYQDLVVIKDTRIKQLEKFEIENFKLKNALGITVAFDIGSLFLMIGEGFLVYSLVRGVNNVN